MGVDGVVLVVLAGAVLGAGVVLVVLAGVGAGAGVAVGALEGVDAVVAGVEAGVVGLG